ncbi:aldehyde dehydrogenase family protein, partial [Streptomyces phaeochromogenes]|uniref:aldehyde dehydrogenase family protein n=1 Tax=Streptomyces phaeochromogenes TaxID=1923 RepID=UPI0033E2A5C7
MKTIAHWINGKPAEGVSGRQSPVYDPATGIQDKQAPLASVDEVDAAIAVAKDAYATWGTASLAKRSTILFKFRALLDAHR